MSRQTKPELSSTHERKTEMANEEKVVVTSRDEIVTALIRLDVIDYGGLVVHPAEVTPEQVAGKIVVGAVAPRIAVAAAEVWEPDWALTLADSQRPEPLRADELRDRYRGFTAWRVEAVEGDDRKATLIATRHAELVDWIRREGLAVPRAPVNEHAQVDDVRGHVVVGIMPLRVAAAAELAINVDLELPRELVGRELTPEQMRAQYRGVIRYRVHPAVEG
jgi:putative CRISPR-associated protein (TIGR02620 family)